MTENTIQPPTAPRDARIPNDRRPTITTTEAHLKNFQPYIPGRQKFSQAARGPSILIVGDSMIQRLRKKDFYSGLNNGFARFNCFPGATVDKLNYYILPELVENKYDTVVIHCGTNDLANKSTDDIVTDLVNFRKTCLNYNVKRVIFQVLLPDATNGPTLNTNVEILIRD